MDDRKILVALAVLSVIICVLSLIGILTELKAEWRPHQEAYRRLTSELASPAGSGPVLTGIQQIMLPELDVYDRCTTCHIGISDPATASAPQPITSHPGSLLDTHPPERFGCTICHGGQGLGTSYESAAHEPLPYFHDPILPPQLLEARCGWCHEQRAPIGATMLAKGRELIVQRGCYGCHEIPGYENEVPAGPDLDRLGSKVNADWLDAWLKDPANTQILARMPTFHLSLEQRRAIIAFLLSDQNEDMEPLPSGLEGDGDRGRALFGVSRCVTCHSREGKGGVLGPDLAAVGSKSKTEWLYAFIRDPHGYHPRTPMLRFNFSPQEALDLAAYLSEELVAEDEYPEIETILRTPELVEHGKKIFVEVGCAGCHPKTGVSASRIGPSLVNYGNRSVAKLSFGETDLSKNLADWTLAKLLKTDRFNETARMPDPRLKEDEAAALTIALLSLSDKVNDPAYIRPADEATPFVPQGPAGAIWSRYRCSTCHQVGGYGGTISQAPLDREGSEVNADWLKAYLLKPYAIRVNQEERMPRFRMTESEADILTRYISMVLRDDQIPERIPGGPLTAEERASGAVLYRKLSCGNCHIKDNKGGYVGAPLDEVENRLKPGWAFSFLLKPEKWRPETLQPDYRLSVEDARSLVAYLFLPPHKEGEAEPDAEEVP